MDLHPKSTFKKIGAAREGQSPNDIVVWLDRLIIGCLFLFAAAAPHSIAATQTAWLLGMLFWVIRFASYPDLVSSHILLSRLRFFILTGVSSFSRMNHSFLWETARRQSLHHVYLVAQNIPSRPPRALARLGSIASSL